jgi:hypothetical protein
MREINGIPLSQIAVQLGPQIGRARMFWQTYSVGILAAWRERFWRERFRR